MLILAFFVRGNKTRISRGSGAAIKTKRWTTVLVYYR